MGMAAEEPVESDGLSRDNPDPAFMYRVDPPGSTSKAEVSPGIITKIVNERRVTARSENDAPLKNTILPDILEKTNLSGY